MFRFFSTLFFLFLAPIVGGFTQSTTNGENAFQPNILWIVVEDMSEHWSCYGENTVQTPNIDQLAKEGELFENTFVTSPICSPSRSALITGLFQTSLGAHNHRSQVEEGKGGGNQAYFNSFQLPEEVPFLPRLFKEAGYYTVLDGKTDYNFEWDPIWYDSNDWENRQPGQPFFAQIQLRGGKYRHAPVESPVDPEEVELPPYYPDDEVLRKDWAEYLNSILYLDQEVKRIYDRLEAEGIADSTAVFLFTDHGISHLRGKQFLYEDGIKIPLIVKWPEVTHAGTRRKDLVTQIDISATSLYLADIPIPEEMQGQSFYGDKYRPAEYIFAARDRGDETVELIRTVRTERYKYIRNFFPHKPHAQPNTYKDKKEILRHMRQLYSNGKLKKETSRYFKSPRPEEELYDLEIDPYEMQNLAQNPAFGEILQKMGDLLTSHVIGTGDLGFLPEPVLEELGDKYGNKFYIMQQQENQGLLKACMEVMKMDEQKDIKGLQKALGHNRASVRFWAAYGLGNIPQIAEGALPFLQSALNDDSDAVKIAAARALCRLGQREPLQILADHLENPNLIVGLYAALFIEDLSEDFIAEVQPAIERAKENPYEFTRRVAVRLTNNFTE